MKSLIIAITFLITSPASAGLAERMKTKFINACESVFSSFDRTPQSTPTLRKSADHKIITGLYENVPNSLFHYNSSVDEIGTYIGETKELPMAEVYLGELDSVSKLMNKDYVIKYELKDGETVSEFGKLIDYTLVNSSWVESVHLETDLGQKVVIPVANVVELHELLRPGY